MDSLNQKTIQRLKNLRNILLLTFSQVERGAGLKKNSYSKTENGTVQSNLDKIGAIILFYGFEYQEFFNFNKTLPNEQTLRRQIEHFHKKHQSTAYKIIYEQPDLIELLEHRLLQTDLFENWKDAEQVVSYCKKKYKYDYLITSVRNTLNNAVKKGWLIRDDKSRPKRYRRKG